MDLRALCGDGCLQRADADAGRIVDAIAEITMVCDQQERPYSWQFVDRVSIQARVPETSEVFLNALLG
jgi:hypothetical protein